MKNDRADKMLRIGDVAERLNVSERTVFRWLKNGDLIGHRFGRNLRISEADLEQFLAAARITGP